MNRAHGSGHTAPGSRSGSIVAYPYTPAASPYSTPTLVVIYYPVAVWMYPSAPYSSSASLYTQPVQTQDVAVGDNYFSPSQLVVKAGTLVRFKNQGQHHHTVTFPFLLDSGPIVPGGEYKLYCPYSGIYHFYCRFHPATMRGTVTVY